MFQRLYKNLLVAIITLIVITTNLSARWKEYNECNIEIMEYKSNIQVNADGSNEEIIEYRVKVLNEAGRESLANFSIPYSKVLSDINVLAAYTITNGTKYVVAGDLISTQAMSSPDMHFKDNHKLSIHFPKVEVGSEVQLSLKFINKVIFPNHYYNIEMLGSNYGAVKDAHCKITSEIPLYIKVNDPHNSLSIKTDAKSEQGSFKVAEIVLNKPLIANVVNEPYNAIFPYEYLTWVSVSNFNKWQNYSEGYDYFAVLAQKLPQIFADIAYKAKNYTDEEEQISFVMSAIIDKIQYKSDARAIKGSMVPRDLQEIASTQVGDCKEFSISTGAILQQLGYKVYPAVVSRNSIYAEKPFLPSAYHFNHAIIKVIGKTGKVYWLDPTNIIVSVDRALPDIAGTMALVFTSNQTASYEHIPQVDYDHAKVIKEVVLVKYDDANIASFQGRDTYKGEKSWEVLSSLYTLRHSPKQVNDYLFSLVSGRSGLEEKYKKHVALLTKIKSRLLQDIAIEYEYDLPDAIYNSNLGKILRIPSQHVLKTIVSTISDQVGDIMLCSRPYTSILKFVIRGQKIKDVSNLNCKINTSWVDIERVCQHVDNDTEIITTVKHYKHIIRNADLKTQEYKILKERVEDMLLNAAVVLD